MDEDERVTLDYGRPEARPRLRPPSRFWLVFFGACGAGFFLMDEAIAWQRGRRNDGGVAMLGALGILGTSLLVGIATTAFPRARVFTLWFATLAGLVAAPMGLLVYELVFEG